MSSEQERAAPAQGQPDAEPVRQSALAGVSEEELVERAKAGEELALEELYRRFYDGIYFLALRQLRDEERAREVAVESFADAFRGLSRFQGRARFSTWLYRISQNRILLAIRQREKEARLRAGAGAEPVLDEALAREAKSPEELFTLRRAYLELVAEIQRLPQDEAFTLIFRFLVGMPVSEIAQVLGISEDGVRMRLGRGRRRLAERLTGKREDG